MICFKANNTYLAKLKVIEPEQCCIRFNKSFVKSLEEQEYNALSSFFHVMKLYKLYNVVLTTFTF